MPIGFHVSPRDTLILKGKIHKKITFALPVEVFEAWEEQGKKIPCIAADLNPAFQGTYCSRIDLKQQNRYLEGQITIAEKISACIAVTDKMVSKDLIFMNFSSLGCVELLSNRRTAGTTGLL